MVFSKHKCMRRKRMSKKPAIQKFYTAPKAKLNDCTGNSTQAANNLLDHSLANIKQSTIDQFPLNNSLYVRYLCKNNIK